MFSPGRSAANYLFTERFEVLIPRSFMYGENYVKKVGYAVTGDPTVDRMQANNLERQKQTIVGLAYLFWQGAEPLLVNEADKVPIYKAIIQHLTDWRDFSHHGINQAYCPPMADFHALENLAQYFHHRVQEMEPVAQTKDRMRDTIMGMNRTGQRSMLRESTRNRDNTIRPFVSLVEDIERNIYGD